MGQLDGWCVFRAEKSIIGDESNIQIAGMATNGTDVQVGLLIFYQTHIRGGVQRYIPLRTSSYTAPPSVGTCRALAPVTTYFESCQWRVDDRTHSLHRAIVDHGVVLVVHLSTCAPVGVSA